MHSSGCSPEPFWQGSPRALTHPLSNPALAAIFPLGFPFEVDCGSHCPLRNLLAAPPVSASSRECLGFALLKAILCCIHSEPQRCLSSRSAILAVFQHAPMKCCQEWWRRRSRCWSGGPASWRWASEISGPPSGRLRSDLIWRTTSLPSISGPLTLLGRICAASPPCSTPVRAQLLHCILSNTNTYHLCIVEIGAPWCPLFQGHFWVR